MNLNHYAGWSIHPAVRAQLLKMCAPVYPAVRCEHITMMLVPPHATRPPDATIVVRGMFDDGVVQALAVMVNGVVQRPDSSLYHITMSHAPGFPSALTGIRMQNAPRLVHEITRWPVVGCTPFIRRLK